MLKTKLLQPDILMALAKNGHGAKILIADGNFPILTSTPSSCQKVFLNLAPGLLTVIEVLRIIKDVIAIESAIVMVPEDGTEHEVHEEFRKMLYETRIQSKKRLDFYKEAKSENTCLAIATGETRRFANILIEIGGLKPTDLYESS